MKKLSVVLLLFVLVLSACVKEKEYSNLLRIENQMTVEAVNCIVGGIDFGTIAAGATTEYKVVPGGVSTLSGGLTGTVTLPENPTKDRMFTLTINADTSISIAEDQ
jgi:hypothetical protein